MLEDDGFVLWESNAITQYLASKKPERGLLPTDPRKCADVSRWQFWESCHWDPACATLIFERMLKKVLGQGDPTPADVEKGEADVRQLGAVLDGVLAGRSHLCGEQLTVADFSVGAWLNYTQRAGYPIDGFHEIRRWYAGLMELRRGGSRSSRRRSEHTRRRRTSSILCGSVQLQTKDRRSHRLGH